MDIKYLTLFYARCRCESATRNHKLPNKLSYIFDILLRGLPFSTYARRGRGVLKK